MPGSLRPVDRAAAMSHMMVDLPTPGSAVTTLSALRWIRGFQNQLIGTFVMVFA